ncbi:hypothetical protein DSECCO2_512380 [anaerobic digester metagenome]
MGKTLLQSKGLEHQDLLTSFAAVSLIGRNKRSLVDKPGKRAGCNLPREGNCLIGTPIRFEGLHPDALECKFLYIDFSNEQGIGDSILLAQLYAVLVDEVVGGEDQIG